MPYTKDYMDPIDKIKQARKEQADLTIGETRHQDMINTSKSLEDTLFQSFQGLISVLQNNGDKGEAIAMVVRALDQLDKQTGNNKTELELIKSGLTTLKQQLDEVPIDSLKQIPKFLEQREVIRVTNLGELKPWLTDLEKAVKAQKLEVKAPDVHVEAPNVNVPAPVVNVPKVDLKPLTDTMRGVIKAVEDNKIDEIKTTQVNMLVSEKFDEWKLVYDDFDDDNPEPRPIACNYYLKGKKVARVNYAYTDKGLLVGGKKA